mmetsp:Transcript_42471/g.133245  ORF Transcript_42471/g.133245 Transcript_42471/m.133245 type:complete len:314 (-) Transcript_42471:40-981(-)
MRCGGGWNASHRLRVVCVCSTASTSAPGGGSYHCDYRAQHEAKRGEVVRVRESVARPRHIQVPALPAAAAGLARRAGLGIPPLAEAVQGDVEASSVLVEEALRAVTVVHVPIKDGNFLRLAGGEHHPCRHRHRVVKAEALGVVAVGRVSARMVAWRPHNGKGGRRAAAASLVAGRRAGGDDILRVLQHAHRRVDHAAAGQPRGRVGVPRVVDASRPVRLAQSAVRRVGAGGGGHAADLVDVALRVDGAQLLVRRAVAREHVHRAEQPGAVQVLVDVAGAGSLFDVSPRVRVGRHLGVVVELRLRAAGHGAARS